MVKSLYIFLVKCSIGFLILISIFFCHSSFAQKRGKIIEGAKDRMRNDPRPATNQTRPGDTTIGFKRRDDLADSINISYKYLDSLGS